MYRRITAALSLVALSCLCHPARAWDFGLQCVPFARSLSGIGLYGNAWRWWSEAAGHFGRGNVPQAGSVLSFRRDMRMPLGHVAVVTRVVGPREIEIDHANWAFPGAISRSVQVVDVSDENDWTTVRVELGRSNYFGRVYTTDGFIYGHPVELGPQIINVAEVLGSGSRNPYVTQVSETLRGSNNGGYVINVAEFLRSSHIGTSASGQRPRKLAARDR